jgi:ABC-type uncharacterized transport system substrate-binding protein
MTRREFILLLGALAAAPLAARAQQSAVPVIGYLSSYSPPKDGPSLAPLLKETGYAEGRNVVVEYRFADGDYSRLPRLAAELVDRRVKMIVAAALPAALAAKAATATIPIVFGVGVDPVEFGLVESLNRPRGNLTGVSFLYGALYEKRLGLLHDLLPSASLIGFLSNQNNPNAASHWRHVEAAARALGLAVTELPASTDDELDKAFETGQAKGIGGMLIGDDPYISMAQGSARRPGRPPCNSDCVS